MLRGGSRGRLVRRKFTIRLIGMLMVMLIIMKIKIEIGQVVSRFMNWVTATIVLLLLDRVRNRVHEGHVTIL